MKGETKSYYSYGNVYKSTAEIFYPKTVTELQELLLFCKKNNRKITLAGSFNSFDQQNSGKDVVVSLQEFNSIKYNSSNHTITVGSGASWGAIFDVVYDNKCVLFTCITGLKPTAGGTLSVNSNSVWTPGNGKEGNHCLEIDILTTEGKLLTCSRTKNSDLFYGVIGGIGFLGFIINITYQVFYVGSHYEIKIDVVDYDNVDEIEKKLTLRKSEEFNSLDDLKGQATLFYIDDKDPKFCVYDRYYIKTKKYKKSSKLASTVATIASGIIRFYPSLASKAVKKDTNKKPTKRLLIKNLTAPKYGLFWAEPDYNWSRKFSSFFQKLGYEPKLYQNSYFIPEGEEKVTLFTKKIYHLINEKGLAFFMFDIMYIPKDECFVLSPTKSKGGFYVNTTFMDKTNIKDLMDAYEVLNQLAFELGGKINLAKNCFIKPELLEKMYAKELKEFALLKEKYDPSYLITSNFFETYFPSFFASKSSS